MQLNDKVNKKTISRMIIDRFTKAMINGELKPGEKLPMDTELAETIGVGRNSVREAIKIMEAFGILEIRRGDGIYVASEYHDGIVDPLLYGIILSCRNQDVIEQFRLVYMQSILLYALELFTEIDIQRLKKLISSMQEYAKDGVELQEQKIYRAAQDIDHYIVKVCDNPMMTHLEEMIEKLSRYSNMQEISSMIARGRINERIRFYEKIVDIIKEKDKMDVVQFFKELQLKKRR